MGIGGTATASRRKGQPGVRDPLGPGGRGTFPALRHRRDRAPADGGVASRERAALPKHLRVRRGGNLQRRAARWPIPEGQPPFLRNHGLFGRRTARDDVPADHASRRPGKRPGDCPAHLRRRWAHGRHGKTVHPQGRERGLGQPDLRVGQVDRRQGDARRRRGRGHHGTEAGLGHG